MIINERAGSGGDYLPYTFRQSALGPLVGKRTWGGLVLELAATRHSSTAEASLPRGWESGSHLDGGTSRTAA